MIKNDRIRKAMSTKGVMSVSVLFLGSFTLGMYKKFYNEMKKVPVSINKRLVLTALLFI
jgi:hypothetical protein